MSIVMFEHANVGVCGAGQKISSFALRPKSVGKGYWLFVVH